MNETAAHTPGPWEVVVDGRGYAHIVSAREAVDPVTEARHLFIAAVQHLPEEIATRTTDAHETEANAHLIAAAPALLEALDAAFECLSEVLEDTDGPDGERVANPLLVQLRAAIAQAKGETP